MQLDDPAGARFLMKEIDILGDQGADDSLLLQSSAFQMNQTGLFRVQVVDEILGIQVIIGRVFQEKVKIEQAVRVEFPVNALLAPEIADARQGGHPRAGEDDEITRFLDHFNQLVHASTFSSYRESRQ